jgi:ribosomal protein L33
VIFGGDQAIERSRAKKLGRLADHGAYALWIDPFVALECTRCKNRNYTTAKSPKRQLRKFAATSKVLLHRETK